MFTGCYELRPTSSQKSFYGKALILTFSDGSKVYNLILHGLQRSPQTGK